MFFEATVFNQKNINNWDVHQVVNDMDKMFEGSPLAIDRTFLALARMANSN